METKIDLGALRKGYSDEATNTGRMYSTKMYSGDDIDLSVDDGEVVATVSTDKIDASGEIVLPKGVDLSRFRKTRQVYFEHNTDGLAIGAARWIKATDHTIVSKYFLSKATEFHRAIGDMVKEGVYRAHSIGFLSKDPSAPTSQELRFHPEWKGAGAIHRSSLLVEFSLVGQPCNDDCLALAVAKGYSKPVIALLSGEAANTQAAAAEVIEAVKENHFDGKELQRALAKTIEEKYSGQRLNKDQVVSSVMQKLYASHKN